MLTLAPSFAANMIASAAIDGSWTAPDGKTVKLSAEDLAPGTEFPNIYNSKRSFASKVFNCVMVNDIGQRRNPPASLLELSPKSWPNDTGEFWMAADGKTTELHGLEFDELRAFAQRAGDNKTFEEYAVDSWIDKRIDQVKSKDIDFDSSADDLLNNLQSAKAAHQLPLIASIDLHQKDLQSAENHHSPLTPLLHAMAFLDVDKSSRMVYISDSTGGKEDGWVPVDTVFAAMQSASDHSN
jgi:hypothetical protein